MFKENTTLKELYDIYDKCKRNKLRGEFDGCKGCEYNIPDPPKVKARCHCAIAEDDIIFPFSWNLPMMWEDADDD